MSATPENKNILLIAMAAETGIAGHHYSMRDLGRAFCRRGCHIDVMLFCRGGRGSSPSLAEFDPVFTDVGIAYGSAIKGLRNQVDNHEIDLVLAFDETSNRIAVCALLGRLETLVPVKPGGISSPAWSAASSEFVVFTAEDQRYLQRLPKFRNVGINQISGRVETPKINQDAVEKLRTDVLRAHNAKEVALCPVRINEAKRGFIELVLKSFLLRRESGETALVLLIIGVEQDSAFRKELEARVQGLPVSIETDPEYTRQLSAVLSVGDEVYAMGRTVMEALLQGCRVFCPSGQADHPFWEVTAKNFLVALSGNFTGRNQGKSLYQEAVAAAAESSPLVELIARHVSSDGAVPQYLEAHERSIKRTRPIIDQFIACFLSRIRLFALTVRWYLSHV